jgi:hypothetical protein
MGGYAAKVTVEIHCATKFFKKGRCPLVDAHKPCPEDSYNRKSDILGLTSPMQKAANERDNES